MLSLWQDGLKSGLFHFHLFFLFPYHLSYVGWHICSRHKLSLFFLRVQKNGNLALVLARSKTCRMLSPLWKRLEGMFSKFRHWWPGKLLAKIEHFGVTWVTEEKMFTMWRSVAIDEPESFSPFLSFVTLVKICGRVVIYLCVHISVVIWAVNWDQATRIFLAAHRLARGGTVGGCSVVASVSRETRRQWRPRVCLASQSGLILPPRGL